MNLLTAHHLVDPGLAPESPWLLALVSTGTVSLRAEFLDEYSRPVVEGGQSWVDLTIGTTPMSLCQLMFDNGKATEAAIPGWPNGAVSVAIRNTSPSDSIAFNFSGRTEGAAEGLDGITSAEAAPNTDGVFRIEADTYAQFGRFAR